MENKKKKNLKNLQMWRSTVFFSACGFSLLIRWTNDKNVLKDDKESAKYHRKSNISSMKRNRIEMTFARDHRKKDVIMSEIKLQKNVRRTGLRQGKLYPWRTGSKLFLLFSHTTVRSPWGVLSYEFWVSSTARVHRVGRTRIASQKQVVNLFVL